MYISLSKLVHILATWKSVNFSQKLVCFYFSFMLTIRSKYLFKLKIFRNKQPNRKQLSFVSCNICVYLSSLNICQYKFINDKAVVCNENKLVENATLHANASVDILITPTLWNETLRKGIHFKRPRERWPIIEGNKYNLGNRNMLVQFRGSLKCRLTYMHVF